VAAAVVGEGHREAAEAAFVVGAGDAIRTKLKAIPNDLIEQLFCFDRNRSASYFPRHCSLLFPRHCSLTET
jgi:hypothetical protein